MKAFGGKLYRPDVARADDGDGDGQAAQAGVAAAAPAAVVKPAQSSANQSTAADPSKLKPTLTNPLFEATPPRKS
jgi:hypothetical protein